MSTETPKAKVYSVWMGRPINELDREELIEVIEWCGVEMTRLRGDLGDWMKCGDAAKYLLMKKP